MYRTVALTFTYADDKRSGILRQYDYYSKSYSKKLYLHQRITLIIDSLIKLFYLIFLPVITTSCHQQWFHILQFAGQMTIFNCLNNHFLVLTTPLILYTCTAQERVKVFDSGELLVKCGDGGCRVSPPRLACTS